MNMDQTIHTKTFMKMHLFSATLDKKIKKLINGHHVMELLDIWLCKL